ncbi:GDP-mannose 4,6-dehydratase [Aquirufa sp.]|jgi:nucleoside-diphosphate-sugar epimerase|uniref:GDP-mannose 4,6-dehydratase n=1 Tax=Aquirufa sp. TaxID=2676249 RepID=UPI0037BEBBDB
MNTILVTGAAGFIGSNLCEKLVNDGYQVIGIDNFDTFYSREIKRNNLESLIPNSQFQFIEGNVGDISTLPIQPDIDLVIHLAAKAGVRPSIDSPADYIENNINQSYKLYDWMQRKSIKKLIVASSSSVYGNSRKVPFSEEDIVDFPISPYAFTKKSGELLTHTFHHMFNFDVLNLRFFTVYGERQRPDLAIHKFAKCILQDLPITLFGDGSTSRDYTYVGDIVNGIYGAINYLQTNSIVYETINLGSNTPIKLIDLVRTLENVIGKKAQINWGPMQMGDVERTFADIHKAEELLGYKPIMSLEMGLAKFINWLQIQ